MPPCTLLTSRGLPGLLQARREPLAAARAAKTVDPDAPHGLGVDGFHDVLLSSRPAPVARLVARMPAGFTWVQGGKQNPEGSSFRKGAPYPSKSFRAALERLAAAYLAEHLDSEDIRIRFDVVSMLIVGESRALLRHHLNALGRSKRRAPRELRLPGALALKAACSVYRAMMTVTNSGIIFSRSRLRPVGFRTSLPGS